MQTVGELDDRLEVQLELTSIDGGVQRLLEGELLDGMVIDQLLEHHMLIAALRLRSVHRHVGVADESLGQGRGIHPE